MNRIRLEYATTVFLAQMRKEFARLHPNQPSPVGNLADYPPEERSALMNAVGLSIKSFNPEADKAFASWVERREQNATQ